jgi:hypothetical protein
MKLVDVRKDKVVDEILDALSLTQLFTLTFPDELC